MATLQRGIGARAIRHAVVESLVHKQDVEANNRRRGLYWLGIEQKLTDGHHEIPGLGGGLYFVRDKESGNFLEVGGDELIARMDNWAVEKGWYLREIADPKCKGGKRWKKTPCKGITGHVITASPWFSNLIYEAARNGDTAKVKELAQKCALELRDVFGRHTHRQVLSVQCHFDTVNLHWHLFASRVGDDHHFIKGSQKKIGLLGPWAVGVLRQGENGFIPPQSTNFLTAKGMAERHMKRSSGSPPVDLLMCKTVDALCYGLFGFSPRLSFWRRVYQQGLPGLCYTRLLALNDAVSREVKMWERYVAQGRDYAPSGISFGRGVNGGHELAIN